MKFNNKSIMLKVSLLLSVFMTAATSSVVSAEEAQNNTSFVVSEIDVNGLQRMELGTFYNLLPLQVGERLDETRVPTIIRSIFSSNSFEDIRLFRDGTKLVIDVQERPTISEITIDGNSDIETDQIIEAMRGAGFAKGEIFDPAAINSIKLGMEEQYFAHGKYSIKIENKIIKQSRNRVWAKFIVNEGEPAKIQKIKIVGNSVFNDEELLNPFELGEGGYFSWFSSGDQYSREKLSGDLETLRSYYLDRGYLKFNNSSTQVAISPDRKGIYVTINVDEGEKFSVEDVTFSGELILSKEHLDRLMPLKKGDTYSAAAVSFAEEQIKTNLGYYGYAFAKVITMPTLKEEENKVELTLFIDPGKKVYVNRVTFSGNESTNDEVLRREVRLMEGGALSTQSVERSKIRLQRLSYLEDVQVETPRVEGESDRVDVNFVVKERSAGTVQGGLGYSGSWGLSLNADVSHSNFMGSGKQVKFGISKNKYSESYRADYWDPYFTIDAITAGVGLEYVTTDYGELNYSRSVLDTAKISANMGYQLNEVSGVNFALEYQDSKLKADRFTRSQQVINFYEDHDRNIRLDPNFDFDLYRFNLRLTRNTLNRGVFPDRGSSQSISLNATLPGSELEFYKLDFNSSYYFPITSGWTFLTKLRASWGDGYGDTESLPYLENFNAGGSGTMRGFENNTIGPHEIDIFNRTSSGVEPFDRGQGTHSIGFPSEFDRATIGYRTAGGNARILGSLELIFPTPFAEENNSLRTSAFVDVGNLWDTNFNINDFNHLSAEEIAKIPNYSHPETYRVSAGLSLQWLSPMGPLTLSLSKVIKQEDNDETESFSFNVGKTF